MVLLALAVPPSATAHGGALLGAGEAGPYRVRLMAATMPRGDRGPAIDFTAYVQDAQSGRPIEDVQVRIAVEVAGRTVARRVQRVGNGYESVVGVPDASAVYRYPVRVDVTGPAGNGVLRVTPPQDGGPPVGLLVGTAVALAGAGAWMVRVRRRR